MNHLSRNQGFQTVKNAISNDHPEVAEGMEKMADCVSASIEIISNQMGADAASNPQYILPMAMEIFKSSTSPSSNEEESDLKVTYPSNKGYSPKVEQAKLDILNIMSDNCEWKQDELSEALRGKRGISALGLIEKKALMILISDRKIKLTDSLGFQLMRPSS